MKTLLSTDDHEVKLADKYTYLDHERRISRDNNNIFFLSLLFGHPVYQSFMSEYARLKNVINGSERFLKKFSVYAIINVFLTLQPPCMVFFTINGFELITPIKLPETFCKSNLKFVNIEGKIIVKFCVLADDLSFMSFIGSVHVCYDYDIAKFYYFIFIRIKTGIM